MLCRNRNLAAYNSQVNWITLSLAAKLGSSFLVQRAQCWRVHFRMGSHIVLSALLAQGCSAHPLPTCCSWAWLELSCCREAQAPVFIVFLAEYSALMLLWEWNQFSPFPHARTPHHSSGLLSFLNLYMFSWFLYLHSVKTGNCKIFMLDTFFQKPYCLSLWR